MWINLMEYFYNKIVKISKLNVFKVNKFLYKSQYLITILILYN